MAFPPGFLDELRSRVSLADLVGKRVRLTRKGREYGGLCPFHNEKTPSFYVVEDKGFFHCFGCGAHGDAIGFVMRSENLDFIEAIERLAGIAGLQVPQQTPLEREKAQRQKTLLEALAAAAKFYEERLWSPAGRAGREYLAGRGLDQEAMHRFRLGWAGDDRNALRRALTPEFPVPLLMEAGLLHASDYGGEPYDYFRERVIFPIGDRAGRVIAFGGRALGDAQPKYLNSPEHPLFEKGRVLYGLSAARVNAAKEAEAGGAGVIVTEGYMDVIALHRAGFTTAVAPLGTALTEAHLAELWRLAPEPVLCFDGDAAGQRAALRALHRALPLLKPGHSLRFVTLPSGEDPDSLIRHAGPPAFEQLLRAAKPLADVLWNSEVSGQRKDTPERLAKIQSKLFEHTGKITDRILRLEFESLYKERCDPWKTKRRNARIKRNVWTQNNFAKNYFVKIEAPPRPPAPDKRQREALTGLLVECPFLVTEMHEDIAALDFPEPELDRLRRAILELDVHFPGLDAEALSQHLGQSGFTATVNAARAALVEHGEYVLETTDPGAARNSLLHLMEMLTSSVPHVRVDEGLGEEGYSDPQVRSLQELHVRDAQDMLTDADFLPAHSRWKGKSGNRLS